MLNKRQTAAFCSQLRSLLAAGLPLLEALTVIKGMPQSKKHGSGMRAAIDKLREGWSLSEALAELLPAMAAGAISGAERAGDLEACLGRLAGYYSDKADLEEKVAGSLIYPGFVSVLCFLSILALVIFVIPGMKNLLADLDAQLPPITTFILWLSDGFSVCWPALIVLLLVMAGGVFRLRRRNPAVIEKMILKTPFLSHLYSQELTIQAFGTLGALLKGGAPIIEALKITINSTGSPALKNILLKTEKGVVGGEKLSGVLEKCGQFPGEVLQMLKIGEKTGQLDQMLINIADFQAKEREALLKRTVSLIEPAMTLIVGLLVGVVVLAMFLPMVSLISSLQ
jgi:type II secretory pathway component PulF